MSEPDIEMLQRRSDPPTTPLSARISIGIYLRRKEPPLKACVLRVRLIPQPIDSGLRPAAGTWGVASVAVPSPRPITCGRPRRPHGQGVGAGGSALRPLRSARCLP
eukprot:3701456-Pleurochrysis_carterae.AAC.2